MPSEPRPEVVEPIRWRRVEDGLPPDDAFDVLVTLRPQPWRAINVVPAEWDVRPHLDGRHFYDDYDGAVLDADVTHWAPWPRGPEGGLE